MIKRVILIVMDSVGVGHLSASAISRMQGGLMMTAPIPCCIFISKPMDWTFPTFVL
jgi:hypothetical protein